MINRYYTHPPRKFKPNSDDPQQHRVYTMEREIIGQSVNTRMKRADMIDVIDYACKQRKLDSPVLKIVRPKNIRGYGFGWCIHNEIHLNANWHGDNLAVLLHELAHYIVDQQHDSYDQIYDHGPEFMRVYIDLLDKFRLIPEACMIMLCEQYDLQVGDVT